MRTAIASSDFVHKYRNCKSNYENWKNDKFWKFILQFFHLFTLCICTQTNVHSATDREREREKKNTENFISSSCKCQGRNCWKSKCVIPFCHSTDLVGAVPHYINSRLWGLNCNSLNVVHSQQTKMPFQNRRALCSCANAMRLDLFLFTIFSFLFIFA